MVWWPKDTGPFRRRKPEGRSDGRRPRRPRQGAPEQPAAAGEPGPAADTAAGGEAHHDGERRPRRHGRGRNRDRDGARPDREAAPHETRDKPEPRERDRPEGPRPARSGDDRKRDDRQRERGKHEDRKRGGGEPRRYEAAPPAADRAADSPFAILGALKEKLARGQ